MLGACGVHGPLKISILSSAGDRLDCLLSNSKRKWWWSNRPAPARSVAVGARLSSFFSSPLGLDSQSFQTHDLSQRLWVGPFPGDIAEVEAYCRIFRAAEQLHSVIMETLCNPETGECAVSYDTTSEDMTQLEEKVVAVLGCMVALLNRAREDVLSGRSSFANSFHITDVNIVDGKLPPLAIFRSEMKRCCESLQVALSNYLLPFEGRSINIWRRLQRLKNVCYDAGFSRGDAYPCPTIFANWGPVYYSTKKEDTMLEDHEVAFWRGGQVTDEGLNWLIEKGIKTIVDLREESVKDEYCQHAIEQAVSCRKIEVLNLPVEVGTAPSMAQVEQFASLVSDPNRRPLYLHSQEGVNRTSAMVSRWRQFITRFSMKPIANNPFGLNCKPSIKDEGRENLNLQNPAPLELKEGTFSDGGVDSSPKLDAAVDLGEICSEQGFSPVENGYHNRNVSHKLTSSNSTSSHGTDGTQVETFANFYLESDPLTVQFPTCNFFSRKEMRIFFKSRKISPKSFVRSRQKKFEISPKSSDTQKLSVQNHETVAGSQLSERMLQESSNGISTNRQVSSRIDATSMSNGIHLNNENFASFGGSVNGFHGVESSNITIEPNDSYTANHNMSKQTLSSTIVKHERNNGRVSTDSVGDLDVVEGDMCASTTGVVRVQSRKKAEMFLVRTDGFSCTREKVTESSLAFTHPSTQQQMLMWKSPPKTVLLLKKLGQELMEEAKEVATFLHYQENMNVLVEPDVHDILARIPGFGFVQTYYNQATSDLHERVDLVTCLGGDGVILHASNLFRGAVPPVVSFNLGSLGFLTSHTFDEYKRDLRAVIHGNNTIDGVYITLRMRLRCEVFRNGKAMPGKVFDVLNEIVVDRGSNPYLSKIECYEHDRLITKVQGDGVIVATPTGSTAYSTAAGGSMDGCMLDIKSHILYSPLHCHIPLPGFEGLRFCVSQYEEKGRLLLKNLCAVLGAKFSSKLCRKSTHLLCKFANGPKYEAACNWGIQSVTAEWLTECIIQDKMVPPDPFWPRPVTIEDRDAGLCTVSQYPTQAANMVSGYAPQQFLSQSQGPMNSLKVTVGNSSAYGKRPRLPESNSDGDASKKKKLPEDAGSGLNVVPDVADAIEDLLAQSNMIQDLKLPGTSSCDQSIFSSDHSSILGQNHANPPSTYEISRHWLDRTEKQDCKPKPVGHEGKVGAFDSFSETQTESQVVGYEEDLTGRQKIIDRVRSQNLTLTPDN